MVWTHGVTIWWPLSFAPVASFCIRQALESSKSRTAILEEQLAALKDEKIAKEKGEKSPHPPRAPRAPPRKIGGPSYALVVPEENEMLGSEIRCCCDSFRTSGFSVFICIRHWRSLKTWPFESPHLNLNQYFLRQMADFPTWIHMVDHKSKGELLIRFDLSSPEWWPQQKS